VGKAAQREGRGDGPGEGSSLEGGETGRERVAAQREGRGDGSGEGGGTEGG
jgi:hypothetical protein